MKNDEDSAGVPESREEEQERHYMVGEKVIEIIAATKHIPRERVSLESTFEELEVDSLDGVEIAFGLEETFNVSIPDEVIRNVQNVSDVVERLERHLAEKGVEPVEAGPR